MPTEKNRKLATKTFETDAGDIKVPVITEITFSDPVKRGQETTYTIDNSRIANRDVHIAWVAHDPTSPQATENADPSADPPDGLIAVERIDLWRVKDPVDRGQETFTAPDNKTYNPSGPPFFTTHFKTHVVNYRQDPTDPDETVLIASELIDEFVMRDPVNRGQETHYYLKNPVDDDEANAQITPDLPDITDPDEGLDPPYRTDPFQNIVKIGGEQITAFWAFKPEVQGIENNQQATGYHWGHYAGLSLTSPVEFDDEQGRHVVIAGNFPNAADTVLHAPSGEYPWQKWAWWYIGPNTDTNPSAASSGVLGGIYFYDINDDPNATFSHTWPFFNTHWSADGGFPLVWESDGQLSVTCGPITCTVDGEDWPMTNMHVAFTGVYEDDGAGPNSMPFNPFFSVTFEPP